MMIYIWFALILCLICFTYTSVIIWSRKEGLYRGLTAFSLVLALTFSVLSAHSGRGFPIPLIDGITVSSGKLQIIAFKLVPEKAIYLYVNTPDEPRSLVMPWDEDTARKLQDAANNPNHPGHDLNVGEWDKSLEDRPERLSRRPYPQRHLPPKVPPPPPQPMVPERGA